MKTPYEILDVAADAGDVEIKQAYLRKVKDNPPDRDPERFQLIHNAYTSIKDHKSRMEYGLFNLPAADFEQLLDRALATTGSVQLQPEQFIKLLHAGADDKTLLNALAPTKKS